MTLAINWNKYIKYGEFVSTNGIKLEFKWEFDRLSGEKRDAELILSAILGLAYPYKIVTIHSVNPKELSSYCDAIYYPKTNLSDGRLNGKYILYDDVVTTGKSLLKAIKYYEKRYNKKPEKCVCIIDRRKKSITDKECFELDVISIQKDVLI